MTLKKFVKQKDYVDSKFLKFVYLKVSFGHLKTDF